MEHTTTTTTMEQDSHNDANEHSCENIRIVQNEDDRIIKALKNLRKKTWLYGMYMCSYHHLILELDIDFNHLSVTIVPSFWTWLSYREIASSRE